jgi:hypothetical protein
MNRNTTITQRERAFAFLKVKGMARLSELIREGVTASTMPYWKIRLHAH